MKNTPLHLHPDGNLSTHEHLNVYCTWWYMKNFRSSAPHASHRELQHVKFLTISCITYAKSQQQPNCNPTFWYHLGTVVLQYSMFSLYYWYKFEINFIHGERLHFLLKNVPKKPFTTLYLWTVNRFSTKNSSTLHTHLGCRTDTMAELHHLAYQIKAEGLTIPVMYHSFWLDKRKRLHFCIQWFAVSYACSFLRKSMKYATLHEFHRRTHLRANFCVACDLKRHVSSRNVFRTGPFCVVISMQYDEFQPVNMERRRHVDCSNDNEMVIHAWICCVICQWPRRNTKDFVKLFVVNLRPWERNIPFDCGVIYYN